VPGFLFSGSAEPPQHPVRQANACGSRRVRVFKRARRGRRLPSNQSLSLLENQKTGLKPFFFSVSRNNAPYCLAASLTSASCSPIISSRILPLSTR